MRVVRCPECRAVVPPGQKDQRVCSYCGVQLEISPSTSTPPPPAPGSGRRVAGFVLMAVVAAGLVATVNRVRRTPSGKARATKSSSRLSRVAEKKEPVKTSAAFEHHRTVVEDDGDLRIYGMVTNTSSVAINAPKVVAVFRDAEGVELSSDSRHAPFDLDPGQSAPVRLLLSEPPAHESVSFDVVTRERTGMTPAQGLEVVGTNASLERRMWLLSGRVKNGSASAARFVKVVVAVKGNDDKLVTVGDVYVDDRRVEAGGESRFRLRLYGVEVEAPRFEYYASGRVDGR